MKNRLKGYSLIEMLVVIAIFSVLSVLVAQGILLSVRNVKRSENTIKVRQDVDNAVGIMERQLRNATSISCPSNARVVYMPPSRSTAETIECDGGAIRWRLNPLTSDIVNIKNCNIFTCSPTSTNPETITININAEAGSSSSIEVGEINIQTEIKPRNYSEQ